MTESELPASHVGRVDHDPQGQATAWTRSATASAEDGAAPSASLRHQGSGEPFTRDEPATFLRTRLHSPGAEPVTLNAEQAEVIAMLLDELAALCPGQDLGRLAREQALALYEKAGL